MNALKHLKGIEEFWENRGLIPKKQKFKLIKGPEGKPNTYQLIAQEDGKITLSELQKTSMSFPSGTTLKTVEKKYWSLLQTLKVLYLTDIDLSISDDRKLLPWTIDNMNQFLKKGKFTGDGITTPFIYAGVFGSTFPLHTEDIDLHSINILRSGAPKFWYTTRIADGRTIEEIATAHHPIVIDESTNRQCQHIIRHKSFVVEPSVLESYGIKVKKVNVIIHSYIHIA